MKDILNRVRGAVARKNLLPILTHFCVHGGTIQGHNGYLTICAPCPEVDLDFTVPAEAFLKAVDASDKEPRLTLLDSGQLRVKSGRFQATLPTLPVDTYPMAEHIDGHAWALGPILEHLKALRPFVGTDAYRAWSHGVLIKDGYMWATNNVVLARVPFGYDGPPVVWPSALVDEVLRIGEPPSGYLHNDTHAEFQYSDGTWLTGTLINVDWPDVEPFFDAPWDGLAGPDIPELLAAVEAVAPFCPGLPCVQLTPEGVSTEDGQSHASFAIAGLGPARLRLEPFLDVLRVASVVDFTGTPYRWVGSGMQGVLVGLR